MEEKTEPRVLDEAALAAHLERQSGVVNRQQVLAAGGGDHDIARLVRRREWARVVEGVYVDHTGQLSWEQRAWAALLFCWPASLAGSSALRAHKVRGHDEATDSVIHVAVPRHRRVDVPSWIRVVRLADYDARVLDQLSPPRLRVEEALLQVASAARDDAAALAVLADACQRRHTTAQRLFALLELRQRLPRRRLLRSVLADVAEGAYSVLEARYLRDVERAHGLPTVQRQRRVAQGRTSAYRDVEYVGLATVVELDGRLGHDTPRDGWRDMDRDLESAVSGDLTLRAGWQQVLQPCRLALAVGRVLAARGWDGEVVRCGSACEVPDSGGSCAPGEGDPPLSA